MTPHIEQLESRCVMATILIPAGTYQTGLKSDNALGDNGCKPWQQPGGDRG
jgi:hypothetical protein